jgi:phosphoribosyl 1,2-cyclic phosphodiesterase
MSLFIASLNSGSNGNCYYVGNEDEAVLIDAGISCRETEKRLKRLELDINKVKAIFITHEHADHIHGVRVLVKKYRIPVYITARTLHQSHIFISPHLINSFDAYKPVVIGNLAITGFPKLHDAIDPHSFVVSCGNVRVGVFTDIGTVCPHVIHNFRNCHAVFLESNYDVEMLDKGPYSYALKNRIRGGKGHISNAEALRLFAEHKPPFMTHLLLSHLSHDNNDPVLVERIFSNIAGNSTQIIVASRFEETPVFHISSSVDLVPPMLSEPVITYDTMANIVKPAKKVKIAKHQFQLTLF